MDAEINEQNKKNKSEILNKSNFSSLISNSNNNSDIFLTKRKKLQNAILRYLSNNEDSLYLKSKYFYRWKNPQNNNSLFSIQILKFKPKRLKFTSTSFDSTKKNKDMRNLLKGKFVGNLLDLYKRKNNEVKYFFEKWKNTTYINKSINYNFKKIKKIKILPKLKSSDIIYPKSNDIIYNNIISILNKLDKSQRKKELLVLYQQIEDIERNNFLKEFKSNNSIISKDEKNIKNKITQRALNRIKNAIQNTDIKQKYFNIWKKLTQFSNKSNKSIKRLNRIVFTRKKTEPNLNDSTIKSNNSILSENELNDYVMSLYKKSDKNSQIHIKNVISDILKLYGENRSQINTPSTPFNDSSFSYSCYDINTERSEEESVTSTTMKKNISERMNKRLRRILERYDLKTAYFKKWKEIVKNKNKKIRKRLVLNKKEKESLMKKFISSNIFSRNKKFDINNTSQDKNNNNNNNNKISISVTEKIPSKEKDSNEKLVKNLNNYLNSNETFTELEGYADNNKDEKDKKNKLELELLEVNDITPKKYRNTEHSRFKTDYKIDIENSFDKKNNISRSSATPGRYKMSFNKVIYHRNKTQNWESSTSKKNLNRKLKYILKIFEQKNLKKYFNIWKNIDQNSGSEEEDDKEDILEIIKTNEIKLVKSNNKNENEKFKTIKEKNKDEIKDKKSSLNGIYSLCYTEDYTKNKNKEEYISLYGNEKSKNINQNIEPHFTDFLKAMNCSIATFNLFTFYSQFHDNKFLLKKKFLPIWRNLKSF